MHSGYLSKAEIIQFQSERTYQKVISENLEMGFPGSNDCFSEIRSMGDVFVLKVIPQEEQKRTKFGAFNDIQRLVAWMTSESD